MEYRIFGSTDLRVSVLGMGCQNLGGGFYHKNDREAVRTLQAACDAGVNFYDTADMYGGGHGERLVGRALKQRRERVILATKVGYGYTRVGKWGTCIGPWLSPFNLLLRPVRPHYNRVREKFRFKDFSPGYIRQAVEDSLKRLGTDYIDLYQLHDPPKSVLARDEVYEVLEKIRLQGKIRYYGVSCVQPDDVAVCLKRSGVTSVQLSLNLLDQSAASKAIPLAEYKNVAVIARLPLAQGLLTNSRGETKAEQHTRDWDVLEEKKKHASKFKFLVHKNRSLSQAALKYVTQVPGVTTVIAGMSRRSHLYENLSALKTPALSSQELNRIRSV